MKDELKDERKVPDGEGGKSQSQQTASSQQASHQIKQMLGQLSPPPNAQHLTQKYPRYDWYLEPHNHTE